MSYEINKTNGEQLTVIADGQVDTTATNLTLIGKNASIYGEYLNENFVKLLESFANPDAPTRPTVGQLWFDTSQNRLKVYDGGEFKSTSGTIVSDSQPFNMTPGDIWVDTLNKRLYFYDGESTILAGPKPYDDHITGFYIEEVAGTDTLNHTVIKIYILEELFGIFSTDEFTPSEVIAGYPTTEEDFNGNIITVSLPVYPGFNPGIVENLKFRVTASAAEALLDGSGNPYYVEDFVTSNGDLTIDGTVTITDDNPLILGSVQSNSIDASVSQFQITSNYAGQEVSLVLKNDSGLTPGLYLKPGTGSDPDRAGIFTDSPTTNFDVIGSSLITGDLEAGGALTVGDGAAVTGDVGVTGDVVVTGSVTLNELLFSGTGPINLSSNNNLTFEAVGDVVVQTASSDGLITLNSLTTLPSKTTAQLASFISPGTPAGTIAYCSDLSAGASLVWFDGTDWLPLMSNPTDTIYTGAITSNDGTLTIYSAYGIDLQTAGYDINIEAGASYAGPGSVAKVMAGQGGEPGAQSSKGGPLYLFAGAAGFDSVGDPAGGDAYLQGGSSAGQGGHVYITGGNYGEPGIVGDVLLQGLKYPKVDGTAGQLLTTNGSGTLSWTTPASSSAPATASSTGVAGQVAYDTDYVYVCVATNTWKRAGLSTW
jgi:hypothetical protein